jgi:hypothetical protein
MMKKFPEAAMQLAARGMAVFPLQPRGKLPLIKKEDGGNGCLDATRDVNIIGDWWRREPRANIGIATGAKSGVFVLDVDLHHDGEVSLRTLEARMRPLPSTVEVVTGSKGRHLYFKLPDFEGAPQIRNSAGKLGEGLDIRGEGGYVVAPPSIHPSGGIYTWSVDTGSAFAEAPVWLLGLICPAPTELDQRRPAEHWSEVIASTVGEGKRNHTIARLGGLLLRRGFNASDTLSLCLAWNATHCAPPLPGNEVELTVKSIASREILRRGGAV